MTTSKLFVLGLLMTVSFAGLATADPAGVEVGDASGEWLAVSATGNATCTGTSTTCVAVSALGDAQGNTLAASATGDAHGLIAVSGTGHASTGFTGAPLAISGCDLAGACL